MHIERFGSGPQTFFGLHGWSGDYRTFAPLLANLPQHTTFYSADLPGCGASRNPAEWTMDSVANEVAEAILNLNTTVTLVGNCSGANIAFFVAQRIPHRVERLITIDAFADWPWYFRVFVNPVFGRYAYFTTFENPVGRWLANLSLRGKRQEDTSLTDGFTRVDHHATYRYLTLMRDSGSVDQFRGFTMPIDITYGQRSFAEVKQSAKVFAALWKQSHVTCLENAGHLPILEATAQLHDLLFQTKGSECITLPASYAN